jgi:hypothetical protein
MYDSYVMLDNNITTDHCAASVKEGDMGPWCAPWVPTGSVTDSYIMKMQSLVSLHHNDECVSWKP